MSPLAPGAKKSDEYCMDDTRELGLAILVAEASNGAYEPVTVVSTIDEAVEAARNDLDGRRQDLEVGLDPLSPERYALWSRDHDGKYQRLRSIDATPMALAQAARRVRASRCVYAPLTLILTNDGFVNVAQACEVRLRYENPTVSDTVWAIDVMLANGSSHLFDNNSPGFDQLVGLLEDHGYLISTKR